MRSGSAALNRHDVFGLDGQEGWPTLVSLTQEVRGHSLERLYNLGILLIGHCRLHVLLVIREIQGTYTDERGKWHCR